jgi:cytochrome-b5 reductase
MGGAQSKPDIKPIASYAAPGSCVFGEDWAPATLESKVSVTHNTRLFTFALADATKPLGLSTCACILAKGPDDAEGKPVVRPYTPTSTNAMLGKFELILKIYDEGKMSQHMDKLEIGKTIDFKHIPFNVKTQYPFGKKKIGMVVGGTGITPMIQALHMILGTETDETVVSMLFGNRSQDDILAKVVLDEWSTTFKDRLSVAHVLSHEDEKSEWAGNRGYINKELCEKHMPPPSEDCMIFVCGPPPMYDALCGPRGEKELTGLFKDMGYSAEQIYKF